MRLPLFSVSLGLACLVGTAAAVPPFTPARAPASPATSSPLDAAWSNLFGLPITNAPIQAVTSFGGQIVVGGSFTQAGTTHARHVASWDGTSWHALGDGLPWNVSAFATLDGQLVAAGNKPPLEATGPSVHVWDGVQWNPVGSTDAVVRALAVFNGELYAAGDFTSMNGVAASRVARWDGTQWHALGTGITGTVAPSVEALAVYDSKLVAAGKFSNFQSIAAWDGASWSGFGPGLQRSGTNADVKGLTLSGADLVAAGVIDHAGATLISNVARWNGSSWSAVGSPGNPPIAVSQWSDAPVSSGISGGAIRPVRWDGSAWVSDGSPPVQPFALFNDGSSIYCGGFGTTTAAPGGFLRFDGASWTVLQQPWAAGMSGLNNYAVDALAYDGELYVAGPFQFAGAQDHWQDARYVTKWNGTAWSTVPAGITGAAYSLGTYGGALVAGGHAYVKRLGAGSWTQLGGTIGGFVLGMAEHGTDLIAVGQFEAIGPTFVNGVARWNGATWSAIGPGFSLGAGDEPRAVISYGGDIIVGGYLTTSGTNTVHHLVRWNGTAFEDFAGGADGPITGLMQSGTDLLVGGAFTHVGGVEAHGAARWNGSSWSALGDNAEYVYRFREHGGRLFGTGEFLDADGEEVYGAAVWTGERWYPLGSGVDGVTQGLDFLGDDLYLAGSFGWAYDKPSFNIARLPSVSLVGVDPWPNTSSLALIAGPNPSRGSTRFTISLPAAGHVRLTVHDVSGRVVASLVDEVRAAGQSFATWTGRAAPGIYLATIETGSARRTSRVVRLE